MSSFQLIRRTDEPLHMPFLRAVTDPALPLPPKFRTTCEIAGVATSADELAEMVTGPELLDMFRALVAGTDTSVPSKFATRQAGAKRVWDLRDRFMELEAGKLYAESAVTPKTPKVKAPKVVKERAPKTPKADGAARPGRVSAFTPDRVISNIVANPKKEGTGAHTRFGYYRDGMTVAQYLAKGGTLADLRWDTKMQFITVAK